MKSDKHLRTLLESIINDTRKLIKIKQTNEELLAEVDFNTLCLKTEDIKKNRILIEESLEGDAMYNLREILECIIFQKEMKEGLVRAQIYNIFIKALSKNLNVEQKKESHTKLIEIMQQLDLNNIKINPKCLEIKQNEEFFKKEIRKGRKDVHLSCITKELIESSLENTSTFARKNDTKGYMNKFKPIQWFKNLFIFKNITIFFSNIRSFFLNIIKEIGKKGKNGIENIDKETVSYSKNNYVQFGKDRLSNNDFKDTKGNKDNHPATKINAVLQENQLNKSNYRTITN